MFLSIISHTVVSVIATLGLLCVHAFMSNSSPAPPLTFNNVLNVVKNVRSWRALGQHVYWFSSGPGLDAIQRQHVSDEACLKDVIENFLGGKGPYSQPSWRALIWILYKSNEFQLAEHIRSFAEPVQGSYTIERYHAVQNFHWAKISPNVPTLSL